MDDIHAHKVVFTVQHISAFGWINHIQKQCLVYKGIVQELINNVSSILWGTLTH